MSSFLLCFCNLLSVFAVTKNFFESKNSRSHVRLRTNFASEAAGWTPGCGLFLLSRLLAASVWPRQAFEELLRCFIFIAPPLPGTELHPQHQGQTYLRGSHGKGPDNHDLPSSQLELIFDWILQNRTDTKTLFFLLTSYLSSIYWFDSSCFLYL